MPRYYQKKKKGSEVVRAEECVTRSFSTSSCPSQGVCPSIQMKTSPVRRQTVIPGVSGSLCYSVSSANCDKGTFRCTTWPPPPLELPQRAAVCPQDLEIHVQAIFTVQSAHPSYLPVNCTELRNAVTTSRTPRFPDLSPAVNSQLSPLVLKTMADFDSNLFLKAISCTDHLRVE